MSRINGNPFEELFREIAEQIAAKSKELAVGTVRGVTSSGISIAVDGDTQGAKGYTCNRGQAFQSGDRVLLGRESGTWVVICRIGTPGGPIAKTAAMTQAVGVDDNGKLWTEPTGGGGSSYTLPVATVNQLGGVKASAAYVSGTHTVKVAADSNGVLYAEKPDSTLPKATTSQLGAVKTSAAYVSGTHTVKVAADANGVLYAEKSAAGYATELSTSASSDTYNVKLDSNRNLVPSHNNSSTKFSLGTSVYPWGDAYLGYYGTVMIGNNSAVYSKIGFFGHTANAKQTLSLSVQNMGYSSVTASNYLVALNNLIGILKEKHGLIG